MGDRDVTERAREGLIDLENRAQLGALALHADRLARAARTDRLRRAYERLADAASTVDAFLARRAAEHSPSEPVKGARARAPRAVLPEHLVLVEFVEVTLELTPGEGTWAMNTEHVRARDRGALACALREAAALLEAAAVFDEEP